MSLEDKAQELEAADWERHNTARRAAPVYGPGDEGYGSERCEDCDSEMPAERRARGRHLCTACTELLERRARQFRRP